MNNVRGEIDIIHGGTLLTLTPDCRTTWTSKNASQNKEWAIW